MLDYDDDLPTTPTPTRIAMFFDRQAMKAVRALYFWSAWRKVSSLACWLFLRC